MMGTEQPLVPLSVYTEAGDGDTNVHTYNENVLKWGYTCLPLTVAIFRNHMPEKSFPEQMKWLDVAAGSGMVAEEFDKAGVRFKAAVALDQSIPMLKLAQTTGKYELLLAHDISQELPFLDDSFDLVTMIGASTYVDCRWGFLREFTRVIKTQGLIILTVRDDELHTKMWAEYVTQMLEEKLVEELEGPFRHKPEPIPYLPNHPTYADKVKVHMIVLRVTKVGREEAAK
uniref:Methyltransferase type 11 domain-containing protein n=1 Tax=Chromera velia CCMP2878 TaxID=1169474 RepID=A0A0G4FLE8_9ALVE|mmetsp:Transcript_35189/g.69410  ORF Transcript_35189/g.69410 Transcript_35189/m.69410 type:complete len:229 (-) Transcript_35189:2580-3266(-)|eukprot:Cvel_17467.t1-p1 / transcript=Cvel_17467.t1 / gene=Cvel_17467 / organism=Chromera_velia_CCMP2878 / gene_product=hypothetical protein / transcript_product=hypothetical protein / location=Cvel_scaffold1395:28296-29793(+) / protein_length=228 / sequence_SO=supercontig / SO=protein_coding / is_pseudo=false